MTIEHLMYTPHDSHHPSTMVILVDDDMMSKYRRGDDSIGVNEVVDSFDVFKYANGKNGSLLRPSKAELESTFGTSKSDQVAEFMLKHGALHHTGGRRRKNSSKNSNDDNDEPHELHSRRHVPRSGRPL